MLWRILENPPENISNIAKYHNIKSKSSKSCISFGWWICKASLIMLVCVHFQLFGCIESELGLALDQCFNLNHQGKIPLTFLMIILIFMTTPTKEVSNLIFFFLIQYFISLESIVFWQLNKFSPCLQWMAWTEDKNNLFKYLEYFKIHTNLTW